jgi:hypothetical protein
MVTIEALQIEDAALRHWIGAVSEAAIPFESRWTWAALKRVDPDIHRIWRVTTSPTRSAHISPRSALPAMRVMPMPMQPKKGAHGGRWGRAELFKA